MKDEGQSLPPGLEGFSWAAFLWGGIWAIGHRVWIGLWAFVPVLGWIMNVVLGVKGREWAYRAGTASDVERFNRAQRSWVVVWLAVAVLGVPLFGGIGASLAIYGVRKYLVSAKSAEARNALPTMAAGMARCAAAGDLPSTSNWVPANLSSVSNMKYQSTTAEWANEPAFACAKISLGDPQYFRYRWHQTSTSTGQFEAEADLDGNGVAEIVMAVGLHCASGSCVVEPLVGDPEGSAR